MYEGCAAFDPGQFDLTFAGGWMRNYGTGKSREDGCRVGNDGYPGVEAEIERRVECCAQLLCSLRLVTVTGIDRCSPQRSLFSRKVLVRSLRML